MRRKNGTLAFVLGLCMLLGGCVPKAASSGPLPDDASEQSAEGDSAISQPKGDAGDAAQKIEELLAGMSLREKVGQLFFVRPDALDPAQDQSRIDDADARGATAFTDAMGETLRQYPVG